eukprot:TRINITY_DN804_c0_g2_i1.p1 TRINITY_DN804_c0_g2~~TRINITY_DN804_c0_g2_i1.p1  ORF type:complete len:469 (-),score=64.75 TRINITY_DN804_c0_g2_i1:743-2149(-)
MQQHVASPPDGRSISVKDKSMRASPQLSANAPPAQLTLDLPFVPPAPLIFSNIVPHSPLATGTNTSVSHAAATADVLPPGGNGNANASFPTQAPTNVQERESPVSLTQSPLYAVQLAAAFAASIGVGICPGNMTQHEWEISMGFVSAEKVAEHLLSGKASADVGSGQDKGGRTTMPASVSGTAIANARERTVALQGIGAADTEQSRQHADERAAIWMQETPPSFRWRSVGSKGKSDDDGLTHQGMPGPVLSRTRLHTPSLPLQVTEYPSFSGGQRGMSYKPLTFKEIMGSEEMPGPALLLCHPVEELPSHFPPPPLLQAGIPPRGRECTLLFSYWPHKWSRDSRGKNCMYWYVEEGAQNKGKALKLRIVNGFLGKARCICFLSSPADAMLAQSVSGDPTTRVPRQRALNVEDSEEFSLPSGGLIENLKWYGGMIEEGRVFVHWATLPFGDKPEFERWGNWYRSKQAAC